MKNETFATIGRNTLVTVGGIANVPAKVDTGADSSSVWASDIRLEGDQLRFKLFGPGSPYYTGQELTAPAGTFRQVRIASSSGTRQQRYKVTLPVAAVGVEVQAKFSLAERETMTYPILLGCSFLSGRFLVDCAQTIADDIHVQLLQEKRARKAARTQGKEQ